MRTATLLIALLCAGLAGCAQVAQVRDFFRDSFREPVAGYRYFFPEPTVVQVSASADQLVYEYSRLYGDEFPHAVAAAEKQCKTDGKRAQVVSMVAKGQDRSWVTFVCR